MTSSGDAPVGLIVVWWLAALAGAVDACGVSLLGDVYVSFMSGNTTSFGVAIAKADWARTTRIAGILVAFIGGAAVGTVVVTVVRRNHLPVAVLIVAVLLAIAAADPAVAVPTSAFAMGMLNAAMQRGGPVKVSITYITGALVKFGQGIGQLLCGQANDWTWLQQAVPWTGLLAGAVVESACLAWFGGRTFAGLSAAAVLVAAGAWSAARRPDGSERS